MEYLKAIFDLRKLPAKFFILFAVVSGFILFAPQDLLNTIKITKFNILYGEYIGLVFVTSTSLVVINFLIWLQKFVSNQISNFKYRKEYSKNLKRLDYKERSVIREFLLQNQSSIEMPLDDVIVNGLISKNILRINRQLGSAFIMNGTNASVSLVKKADKLLTSEDIDWVNEPTDEDKRKIYSSRPHWAMITKHRWP